VDTYCRVLINGDLIDTLNNYFTPSDLEIKDNLLPGENEIRLEFIPIDAALKKTIANSGGSFQGIRKEQELEIRTRRPRYLSGGDRKGLSSFGVFGDMYIESNDIVEVNHINFKLLLESDGRAKVLAKINVNVNETGAFKFESTLFTDESKIMNGKNRDVIWTFFIDDFEYWYPAGLGKQRVYRDELIIQHKRLDGKTYKEALKVPFELSFNKIELIQNPKVEDEFSFEIEGQEIQINAALYKPLEVFPSRVGDKEYAAYFAKLKKENINMVRVWGGGGYADDEFYEYCDSFGIMVWQEFAFTGVGFYADSMFVDEIRRETNYQARRVVKHASFVLFSGNEGCKKLLKDENTVLNFGFTKKELKSFEKQSKFIFETVIKHRVHKFNSRLYYKPYSPDFNGTDQEYGFGRLRLIE